MALDEARIEINYGIVRAKLSPHKSYRGGLLVRISYGPSDGGNFDLRGIFRPQICTLILPPLSTVGNVTYYSRVFIHN